METATRDTVDQTFTVGEPPELVISNVAGEIAVHVGDAGVITVHALKRGSREAMDNTTVEMSQDGNTVRVETRSEPRGWIGMLKSSMSAVDYTVTVPHHCRVKAKGVSAAIAIAALQAPVSAETVSGAITVRGAQGECRATSVSGSIELEAIEGELQARTTSGRIAVLSSRLRTFNLQSVSGAITADTPLARDGHYFGKTVSGSMRLLVPEDTGATVHMKTVSGRTTVEMPADVLKAGPRNWRGRIGRINGGGATVEFTSVSGSLSIGLGTDGSIPEGGASDEEGRTPDVGGQSEILRALEQGEISVEDALSRLQGLR